jgi:hypothetical protein
MKVKLIDMVSWKAMHVWMAIFLFAVVTSLISGCSVESKLNRSYKGKSFTEVMNKMGAPTNIENRVGGGTIRTYESKKMLKPAPINTGQFQYDRFESPKVLQTIVTTFIVDPTGKVVEVKYSNDYSR